jgi:hypothetical protein
MYEVDRSDDEAEGGYLDQPDSRFYSRTTLGGAGSRGLGEIGISGRTGGQLVSESAEDEAQEEGEGGVEAAVEAGQDARLGGVGTGQTPDRSWSAPLRSRKPAATRQVRPGSMSTGTSSTGGGSRGGTGTGMGSSGGSRGVGAMGSRMTAGEGGMMAGEGGMMGGADEWEQESGTSSRASGTSRMSVGGSRTGGADGWEHMAGSRTAYGASQMKHAVGMSTTSRVSPGRVSPGRSARGGASRTAGGRRSPTRASPGAGSRTQKQQQELLMEAKEAMSAPIPTSELEGRFNMKADKYRLLKAELVASLGEEEAMALRQRARARRAGSKGAKSGGSRGGRGGGSSRGGRGGSKTGSKQ